MRGFIVSNSLFVNLVRSYVAHHPCPFVDPEGVTVSKFGADPDDN